MPGAIDVPPVVPELTGLRVLIVEDWHMVALEVQRMVERLGCKAIGPVARLEDAMSLVATQPLDGALLDVDIQGQEIYPVARELLARGVPIIFSTGYLRTTLPPDFRDFPAIEKPFALPELHRAMMDSFVPKRMA